MIVLTASLRSKRSSRDVRKSIGLGRDSFLLCIVMCARDKSGGTLLLELALEERARANLVPPIYWENGVDGWCSE